MHVRPTSVICYAFFVCALLLSAACSGGAPAEVHAGAGGAKRLFVVVLIDETSSCTMADSQQVVPIWSRALPVIAGDIVGALHPGDAFSLIALDDHGQDPLDLKLEAEMPVQKLLMNPALKKLKAGVLGLKKREPMTPRTDVIGALRHAERLAENHKDCKTVLIAFSDMRHNYYSKENKTKTLGEEAVIRDLGFPWGTECYCYYVPADDIGKTTKAWAQVFQYVNLAQPRFYMDETERPLRDVLEGARQGG